MNAPTEGRCNRLMSRQLEICRKDNKKYVGKTFQVLIEGSAEGTDSFLKGRTYFQAPEIDGLLYINKGVAEPGTFARVRITEVCAYDLRGAIV